MSPVDFSVTPAAAQPEQIAAFEAQHGITLPDPYRRFLIRQNGGRPLENLHFVDSPDGPIDVGVNWFYGLETGSEHDNLAHQVRFMHGSLPVELIPIAEASAGDLIVLKVSGDKLGSVWLWNHEWEPEEGEPVDYRNIVLVSADFDELLQHMQPLVDPDDPGSASSLQGDG